MINSKDEISYFEIDVLTDAELDSINGGNRFLDRLWHAACAVGHVIGNALHGPGDLRPPTKQP
jgi:hypothetical protein